MKIVFHLPRESEATITPNQKQDFTVIPKFYRRVGWFTLLHFTTVDAKGREEPHILSINATNKQIRVEKLTEVIPAFECEDEIKDKSELTNEEEITTQ